MKKLFSIFAIVLFVACFVQAQDFQRSGGYARVMSMGNNMYIMDPENIKGNSAFASMYENFIWGDVGSQKTAWGNDGNGQFVGFNFKITSELDLGLLLSTTTTGSMYNAISDVDPFGVVSQINGIVAGSPVPAFNNNMQLFGNYKFGNSTFGLGLAYASTTNDFTPATSGSGYKSGASQLGLNLGVVTALSTSMKLDAALNFISAGAKFEPQTGNKVEVSRTGISVMARLWNKMNEKMTMVPLVGFMTQSGEDKAGTTTTDAPSYTQIVVGCGFNYHVGDFLLAGGPSFMLMSRTDAAVANVSPELKTTTMSFPVWNFGVEWMLTDWMTGRFGYYALSPSTTMETAATSTTKDERILTDGGWNDFTLGVGFKFGNFSLDAYVNDDVLRQGFNNIGGGQATFAYLSTSYAF